MTDGKTSVYQSNAPVGALKGFHLFPVFTFVLVDQIIIGLCGEVVPLFVERERLGENAYVSFPPIMEIKVVVHLAKGKDSIERPCSPISDRHQEGTIITRQVDAMCSLEGS